MQRMLSAYRKAIYGYVAGRSHPLQAGLEADAEPTPELKVAQRQFFVLLYRLLVGRDTGPRLPTLLLAIGSARVRSLLGG